ncbi:hypothetical protein [Mesorhizobium sp. f-mel]
MPDQHENNDDRHEQMKAGQRPRICGLAWIEHVGSEPGQLAAGHEVRQPGELERQNADCHHRIEESAAGPQRDQHGKERNIGEPQEIAGPYRNQYTGVSTATKSV